uniref:glucuronosyltransferase n=1 Tax=Steinernema glaseri TaxID=37863 RepID=A0A1I8A401_9BILA
MWLRLSLLLSLVQAVFSLNVLLFLIGTTQFERSTFEYLAQQLALRHHNTITVKPILIPEEPRLVKPKLHLVREKTLKNMLPKKLYSPLETVGNDKPWRREYVLEDFYEPYWAAHNHSCHKILNSNLMDTLKKDQIEVAIVYSGNPCQLAIAHVLGIPYIYFDLEGFTDETLIASGTPWNLEQPLSNCFFSNYNVPKQLKRLTNGLCLFKELIAQSGISSIASVASKRYRLLDGPITKMFATDYEIKKKFPNFPDVNTLKQNAEFYFVNTDPLLEGGSALSPHVIPVGGLHIDHVKPLFSPWNTTIAAAKEGVIVVSLGTQANSSAMTQKQAKTILSVLSRFDKHRIYWRVGPSIQLPGIDAKDVPDHINITAFIPQNDLIAMKQTRLLITNGGMSSVMEALVHGVPIVGIPLYGANRQNLQKLASKGLGLFVEKSELTEANLYNAMKEVLETAKYRDAAKDMSREWKDRGKTAFDRALHYIEHVGRHRSAKFFKPAQSCCKLLRHFNLDFLLITVLIVILPFYVTKAILSTLFGCCLPKSTKSEGTLQKHNKQEKAVQNRSCISSGTEEDAKDSNKEQNVRKRPKTKHQ